MLIFQYFLIIFIKMVECGICDDQVDQAGIQGATHTLVIFSVERHSDHSQRPHLTVLL